ncbi:MAG: glycerophosphodiester phosphodiesterase family protein [Acidobacteriota bacterium]|nr:glycerophosphodiester phosphodiesterase family protein [Acidobacteriota bacterium]
MRQPVSDSGRLGVCRSVDHLLGERRRPLVIAHRGSSATHPENTLAACQAAVTAGAEMVEVDLRLTADGQVVLMHDATVDRTTDGTGAVRALTMAEIRRLDAGSWFHARNRGEAVPTLDGLLHQIAGQTLLNLEIKCDESDRRTLDQLASAVTDAVGRSDTRSCVLVSSYSPRIVRFLTRRDPAIRTALLHPGAPSDRVVFGAALAAGAQGLHIGRLHMTGGLTHAAQRHGLFVAVHTINDERDMGAAIAAGVDAVFTDHPWLILAARAGSREPSAGR